MTGPSASPLNALQAAIVAKLKLDAAMTTLVAGRVFDEVPEGETRDYVVVGDTTSVPDNDLTSFGRQVTATIHVWTRANGFKRGQTIADRVTALFDHQPGSITISGHEIVSIRQVFDQAIRDPDPAWRHHILRFRINTSQEG